MLSVKIMRAAWTMVAVVCGLLFGGGQADAANATASLETFEDITTVFRNATDTFYVYSKVVEPQLVGPNSNTSREKDGVQTTPVPFVPTKIVIRSGVVGQNKTFYSPIRGIENSAKPASDDRITSSSMIDGGGGAISSASYHKGTFVDSFIDTVKASAELIPSSNANIVGGCAATSDDPATIDPGVYSYYHLTLDATLQMDTINQSGGVSLFALDSRLTNLDTFYQRDEPLEESLWALTLYLDHVANGTSDVVVDFYVNPLARSMGILDPAQSDAEIAQNVRDALTISGNSVSLTDFSAFQPGTMYTVRPEDGPIEYAGIVDAGMQAVPEPAALSLFALALLAASTRPGTQNKLSRGA